MPINNEAMVIGYQIQQFSCNLITNVEALKRMDNLFPYDSVQLNFSSTQNRWMINWFHNKKRHNTYRARYYYSIFHNVQLSLDYEVHHEDENKTNDYYDNLIALTKEEHLALRILETVELVCDKCQTKFVRPMYQHKARMKRGDKMIFCSRKCYYLL